ncbi:MAG TPA: regulator [Flavobacteriales bacterium]|nr:regulator [Flavobacteriales bacterium]
MRIILSLAAAICTAFAVNAQSPFPCELSGGEGDPATGGLSQTQVGQYHDNSNFFNIIELYQPVTLVSAKVFANGAGPRTLALFSPEGDVLMTEVVDIPDGESIVEFGWDVGPGTVGLGSLSNNPQLWRDDLNSDINYPYEIGDYGAITGTSIQGDNEFNYYYFFYDVTLAPQGPTVNSGGYPCDNVELLDVEPLSDLGGGDNGNDCWGWVDHETGREIAIFGRSNGTSFIDVTDPTDMKYFANLPTATSASLWRDIKVYGEYAYIVSEAGDHGLQIVHMPNLMGLSTDEVTTISPDGYYSGFGNAHNIMINEETGYAYPIGTNTFNGGLHVLNLVDPLNPVLVGAYDGAYSHDIHPIVYNGPDQDYLGDEIVVCFNGYNGIAIVNAEDKDDIELISQLTYAQSGYTHQGWVGENQRFCYFNDELDESNFGNNTRTYIMDIEDLDAPEIIGYFEAPVESVDHNMYIIGDKMYQSNYLSGLRVLDVSDAANGTLELVGYFDTNPESDAPSFNGTWSNYPYFPSGNIGVSTFTHFFMLRPSDAIAPNPVSIDEPAAEEKAAVYPNPAQSTIQLEGFTGEHHLALFGMDGQLIKAWEGLPGTVGLNLTVGHLPEGVYVLKGMETGRSARFVVAK